MNRTKKCLGFLALLSAFLLLSACNPLENESNSNSLLTVMNLTGTDIEGNVVNFLESDVLNVDPTTGGETIHADVATATLRVTMLDPQPINPPSQYSDIIVTRYIVSYMRSDGKSTEGVDVPYTFEGYLSTLIGINTNSDISFVIVRAVSKGEPPLSNLAEGRGEGVLEVRAKVEFYGHDMTNKTVKATGYLTIFFANYTDQ